VDSDTRAWACRQVQKYSRYHDDYVVLADSVRQVLEHVAATLAPHAIVQARAKTISSFAGKILRKRATCPNPVEDLTDLCGGRLIVQTREQVDRICEFLEQNFAVDWEHSEDAGSRLEHAEFGYLSRHYTISFQGHRFPNERVPIEVPARVAEMPNSRAEIQVRTLLQHAWAELSHELMYKSGLEVPRVWQRELARLAAMLEASDESIARLEDGLEAYASSYGAYMDDEQLEAEADLLLFVYEQDPESVGLALQIASVAKARGDWTTVCDILGPHKESGDAQVLLDLGVAVCRSNANRPRSEEYLRGKELIEAAAEADERIRAVAQAELADAWKPIDDQKAADSYRLAFDLCPGDPHVLEQHLSYEIRGGKWASVASAAGPAIQESLRVCRARIEVGVDLPQAHLSTGFFLLLSGSPYEALGEYAKGVHLSTSAFLLEQALSTVERIVGIAEEAPGVEWVRRVLLLGLAVRFPSPQRVEGVNALSTQGVQQLRLPVVILAGSCAAEEHEELEPLSEVVMRGFEGFEGTIIGGGTSNGVSGLVGALGTILKDAKTVGYLPQCMPVGAVADGRYEELRTVSGGGFDPLGPLQAWIDLVASGIDVRAVRVLGIGGGRVSAASYRLALGLGATVATLVDSGREAARIQEDSGWTATRRLLRLPVDTQSIRAFVGVLPRPVDAGLREVIAKAVHAEYLRKRLQEAQPTEPSLVPWAKLSDSLKDSNRLQADDMLAKLNRLGLKAVSVRDEPVVYRLSETQVDELAEAEHGRWVVERLLDGWRYGEVKDVASKVSPYLVGWSCLSEEVRQWDRDSVVAIPKILAAHGLEIRETTETESGTSS